MIVNQSFTKISELIPDVIIDLKYMTSENFLGKKLYEQEHDLLRYGTLKKLQIAADILRKQDLRLVVWDAYRPLSVQEIFWNALPDERFVAPPKRGSKHNRGCAVDITLATLDGAECQMPTEFDDFTPAARADRTDLDAQVQERLTILQSAMSCAGFEVIEDEWWHFNDTEWSQYPIE